MGWVVNASSWPFYPRELDTEAGWAPWPVWTDTGSLTSTQFFFVFSCTLYFIRTCFFVLIVLHFAFCLYLQHTAQTSMLPVAFELATQASDRPHTFALDRSAIGIGWDSIPGPSSLSPASVPTELSWPLWDTNSTLNSPDKLVSYRAIRTCPDLLLNSLS